MLIRDELRYVKFLLSVIFNISFTHLSHHQKVSPPPLLIYKDSKGVRHP